MDFMHRIKDSVFQYLSPPAKRRRTIGPDTSSHDARPDTLQVPISEPRDKKTRAAALRRVNKKSLSPSNPKKARKRSRDEYEDDEDISPDDSISQITPQGEESDGVETESEGDEATDDGPEIEAVEDEVEEEEVDEEAAAEAKVQEYLARQAELALIREEVEKVKAAGNWHPDEIFLFERLSMRNYEEVIPAEWQIDLPTLPETLFTDDPEKMFVKNNFRPSYSGTFYLLTSPTLLICSRCQSSAAPPCSRTPGWR